jgi:hypothetical protein
MRDQMELGRTGSASTGRAARPGVGLVGALGIAALMLALPDCGSQFSGVCDKQRQCTLGDTDDQQAAYDTCIAESENQSQVADDYSCSTAFNTYASCIEASASCVSGEFMTGDCSKQLEAVSACEAAASSLHGGASTGSGGLSSGTGTSPTGGGTSSFSCDLNMSGEHLCERVNTTAAQAAAFASSCTQDGGTSGTSCSNANALGTCTETASGTTVEITYYSGSSLTAASAQQSCSSGGGTWSAG